MTATASDDLEARVLTALLSGFPVSESPYCDLGAALGADEIDVLSAALELRECGRVASIAACFADFDAFVGGASQDDADIAYLVGTDLPTSEHPYAEVAAQLQLRGVDQTADGVIACVLGWIADGTVTKVAAQTA